MIDDVVKETHPGFTITCDKCGSTEVYLDDDRGWSETSGGWGSVDLVCNNCNNICTIIESY